MDFSDVLRAAIKRSGLSQAGLGRACGLKGPHVNMICQRKATPPIELLEKMADALDLHGDHRAEFILHAHLAHAPEYVRKYIENLESEIGNLRDDVKEVRSLIAENEHNFESRVAVAIEQYKAKPPPIPEAWPMPKERVKST